MLLYSGYKWKSLNIFGNRSFYDKMGFEVKSDSAILLYLRMKEHSK